MDNGFVVLYRKFKNWGWYSDANVMRVFVHCLISASYCERKYLGIDLNPGEFITSISSISRDLDIKIQPVRTAIKKLCSTGEITIKTTSRFTIISVCNFESYQDAKIKSNKRNNKRVTNEQQTSNKRVTNEQQQTTIEPLNHLTIEQEKENIYAQFDHLKLSKIEFDKLIADGYSKSEIDEKIMSIQNYAKNKKYKSLNITIRTWINKERKENGEIGDNKNNQRLKKSISGKVAAADGKFSEFGARKADELMRQISTSEKL